MIGSKLLIKPFGKDRSQAVIKDIFAKLQLSAHNQGVFNGKWGGKGPVVESVDPSTGQPIAKITTVEIKSFIYRARWKS